VIPREGVERTYAHVMSSMDAFAGDLVIPREGVERLLLIWKRLPPQNFVIPREGVERSC